VVGGETREGGVNILDMPGIQIADADRRRLEAAREAGRKAGNLCFGLPHDFDFGRVRSVDEAGSMMSTLPNRDRGIAAKGLYKARKSIGRDVAFAGMMSSYEHDHQETLAAFGGYAKFSRALRHVAPKHEQREPVHAWRGVFITTSSNHVIAACGVSWTTDRNIAAWFATRLLNVGVSGRPFVFKTYLWPTQIITFWNERNESEVIVDANRFYESPITLDTDGADLITSSEPSPDAIASWREAARAYRTAG
jgi:hypothetical protein